MVLYFLLKHMVYFLHGKKKKEKKIYPQLLLGKIRNCSIYRKPQRLLLLP